ncbi:hypothetical protein CHLNCDRAFT_134537 [Chlorella variabilis]|uniref:Uncharacterized protein n=1 Tax=Chlorella variabilis TaxID=554065 RepID=E1ZG62_CHLVA|nr:hypothetical protein CHLNCDRAFT_134537 [Chlorella variabilis]EFN55411.1 hypothetical protein CHLNCDRAFT_134537 [Chlorella variabilis]|eukprot:XP_005847513.1 hypothetical protein CHLNCDRAFT_134537 [Chlorella variabilis]
MSAQQLRSVDDLEDALLEVILAHACAIGGAGAPPTPCYRHSAAIPQVCKRWSQVYVQSTVLWQELRLDWAVVQQQADGGGVAFAAAAAWLASRLPYARRLIFRGCHALAGLPQHQLFPGGLRSSRLREALFLDTRGSFGPELGLLRGCPGVQAGEALHQLVALPALQRLDLRLVGSTSGVVTALAGLTQLALSCRMESAALAPDLLEGLSQLRRLELRTVRLAQFTPRLAQALARLTHLACADVLAAQPRRRAGIQLWEGLRHLASLRELFLENQSGAGMPGNALACTGLLGLTLLSCAVQDWPALPRRYAGESGCIGRLQSLHLGSLRLARPVPPQLWALAAPALTSLTWHSVTSFPAAEELHLAEGPPQQLMQASGHSRQALGAAQAAPVPAEWVHLQQLQALQLEYAQLDVVPPAVQGLLHLTCLSLEGNRLTTLPVGQYLTGLERLSLANNALAEVPEGLTACSSLRELSLADNPQLVVGSAAAQQLAAAVPHLERLRLNMEVHCGGEGGEGGGGGAGAAGGKLRAQMEGLQTLTQLLGNRLVLEP